MAKKRKTKINPFEIDPNDTEEQQEPWDNDVDQDEPADEPAPALDQPGPSPPPAEQPPASQPLPSHPATPHDSLPTPLGITFGEIPQHDLLTLLTAWGVPNSSDQGRNAMAQAYWAHLDKIHKTAGDAAVIEWLEQYQPAP